MKRKSLFLFLLLAFATPWAANAQTYTISSADEWNAFCNSVNTGTYYEGRTVQLTNDITISKMAGLQKSISFRGTFDGQGHTLTLSGGDFGTSSLPQNNADCAPFRFVAGATFQNLKVAGDIYSSSQRAAGFIGTAGENNLTFTNCVSAVHIHASRSNNDGTHGGFIGNLQGHHSFNLTATFNGCAFTGSITTTNGTNNVGGFVGWCEWNNDGNDEKGFCKLRLNNCIVAPNANCITSGSKTFARFRDETYSLSGDGGINNSYYLQTIGDAQGKRAFSVTGDTGITVAMNGNATTTYNVSGIDVYSTGIVFNGTIYAGSTEMVSLNLSGGSTGTYVADQGNLSGSSNPYMLIMPSANVSISTALLHDSDNNYMTWAQFAANVNSGNNYSGKTIYLDGDITVSTMVGTSSYPFSGTFDGGGHTMTLNLNASENYCAPFRYISGATIKFLKVNGTINGNGHKQLASIVGSANGSNRLINCWAYPSISTTFSGDSSIGGLIASVDGGQTSNGTTVLTDCLFSGSFICSNAHSIGGFVGWTTPNNNAKSIFTNCLYNPTSVSCNTQGCKTFARYNNSQSVFFANCYYKNNSFGTDQGTDGSGMSNEQLLAALGVGWQISGGQLVPVTSLHTLTGSGTEGAPYQIASASDWDKLAFNVNVGESYSGKHFKLMNNISVTTMVGDRPSDVYHLFSGIFDGDGKTLTVSLNTNSYAQGIDNNTKESTAPFRVVGNATIKNLHVDGTIETSGIMAAGIVAEAEGITSLLNCISSVAITSNLSGDGTHGGLVGRINRGTTTIIGCVFNGKLLGAQTYNCGGFVSWNETRDGASLAIENGLFAPSEISILTNGDKTFARSRIVEGNSGVTITNSYYTQAIGDAQGYQAYSVTSTTMPVAMAGTPTLTYDISRLSFYGTNNGLTFNNNVPYGKQGDQLSVNIDYTSYAGYTFVPVSNATINGGDNPFTFTMPNGNVEISASYTATKEIKAYSTGGGLTDGWYLIATPIGEVNPEYVTNMTATENTFDIYRFNQSPSMTEVDEQNKYLEWENWKRPDEGEANHYHFDLEPGRGYLYANSADVTLTFTGMPYVGDGVVSLEYKTDNPVSSMHGWNLIGNPFGVTATIGSKPFYRMNYGEGNTGGTEIIVATDINIAPMEGIFVHTTDDGETVTFNTEPSRGANDDERIVINLCSGPSTGSTTAVIDRAIVRFGEGQSLPKFQIRDNSTKIYIPQDGKDYAIACAEGQGEMPLNFKANENGTYTLSINPEGVEKAYLHLIDNMTGADVDLLAATSTGSVASYTFNAKTTDYESRFRLVFVANSEDGSSTGSEAFAFISNGNIIVNGEGMLQGVDVMGRVIVCRDSVHTVSTAGMTAGVYVLRLINGEKVKVQKMVVR